MYDYKKIKYLYAHEKEKLFTTIRKDQSIHHLRNKAIFFLIEYAGLRASEISLIKESDFNIPKKEIYLRRLKKSNCNTLRIIDQEVYNLLVEYIHHKKINNIPSDYLFVSQKGFPISRKQLDKIMKNYCKLANISKDKSHCHALKHTRAITLAELGLDTKEIQYWIGHKSIENTEIYFQFTTRQKETLYQKIEFLKNQ